MVVSSQLNSLGMIIDSHMRFDSHVGAVARVCNYHTRILRHVRKHLTIEMVQTIAWSVISSRIDYCDWLLYGAPIAVVEKLQRAQNNRARVICQQRRCVHAIPLLKTVHWLPVQQCTQYKIADIMHRALSTSVTPYIDELLQCQVMSWSLWSIDALCLSVSWTCTETAKRAFCVAAANVWNSLPNDIRNASSLFTFRAKLKILFYCCIPVLVMNMPPSHLCIDF